MDRHGYYVEGKHFGGRVAQAISFAKFRATEFGRPVEVTLIGYDKSTKIVETCQPEKKQVA